MQRFNREDGEAILCVPLSKRIVFDSTVWTFTKSGEYSVRFGYHVARQLQKEMDWAVFQRSGGRGYMEGPMEAEIAKQNQSFWLACMLQYTTHLAKLGAQKNNTG